MSYTKIQALSVNFDNISDIGPKGHSKSEKNTNKMEHFSFVLIFDPFCFKNTPNF
jgi:hypothetical protein